MTRLIHAEGDIFTAFSRGIGHGVNTEGVMGSGIAVQFRKRLPEMYDKYREICLMGGLKGGDIFPWELPRDLKNIEPRFVYNIASQELQGANAYYHFLEMGVHKALLHAESVGLRQIALPRIGSGVGGLDITYVEGILFSLAARSPVDIELWTYNA